MDFRGEARLISVNVGVPAPVPYRGNQVATAIAKRPVSGRVGVRGVNVNGDDQADRNVHGGIDKAVYAYASEDYAWWSRELASDLPPGKFGENLTTQGIDASGAVIGERWEIGTVTFEVSEPRLPCFKLGITMGDQGIVKRFADAARYGAYLRIVREGELGAGDAIRVVHRPTHGLTVADVGRGLLQRDPALLERFASAPELAARHRERAAHVGRNGS